MRVVRHDKSKLFSVKHSVSEVQLINVASPEMVKTKAMVCVKENK